MSNLLKDLDSIIVRANIQKTFKLKREEIASLESKKRLSYKDNVKLQELKKNYHNLLQKFIFLIVKN
jgi:hypothetical protein